MDSSTIIPQEPEQIVIGDTPLLHLLLDYITHDLRIRVYCTPESVQAPVKELRVLHRFNIRWLEDEYLLRLGPYRIVLEGGASDRWEHERFMAFVCRVEGDYDAWRWRLQHTHDQDICKGCDEVDAMHKRLEAEAK